MCKSARFYSNLHFYLLCWANIKYMVPYCICVAMYHCRIFANIQINISLTHWGRVTHICVGKLTIIGSDNGLSPERRQAIVWTNAGILLIGPLGTNFSEILIEIQTFSLKKIPLKMSSAKCCSFRFGLNVLKTKCFALLCYTDLVFTLYVMVCIFSDIKVNLPNTSKPNYTY